MKKTIKNIIVMVTFLAIALSVEVKTEAATPEGVIDGPNEVEKTDSFSGTYGEGKTFAISIANDMLTIVNNGKTIVFQDNYNQKMVVDEAVVNSEDRLLHILGLGGEYWVWDLDTNIFITAYRNMSNGKYCSSRNSKAYMVIGKTAIDNFYFWESFDSSRTRQRWMTRAEFDAIINGGDPSEETPTVAPTVAPTTEPTAAPTVAPTAEPTQAPATAAPTKDPVKVEPTKDPTPTRKPDIEIDSHSEFKFDIEFWWKRYLEGTITWEQFTQITGNANWKVDTEYGESEITYYFYDESGKLIRTEKITTGKKTETGTGTVEAKVENAGKAEVKVEEKGEGEIKGEGTVDTKTDVYVNNPIPIVITNVPAAAEKEEKTTNTQPTKTIKPSKKTYWSTTRQGHKVKLWRTIVKSTATGKIKSTKTKISVAVFNERKGWVRWDGTYVKNVKKCQFIKGSHNLLIITRKGWAYSYPCGKGHAKRKLLAKGVKTYKCVSTKYNKGLVTTLVKKKGKLVNVVNK